MDFPKELLEKAKTAGGVEELLALAKAENVELTAEEAKYVFSALHASGEVSDEELDNVAGGGCGGEPSGDKPKFAVGQTVKYRYLKGYRRGPHCVLLPDYEERTSVINASWKDGSIFRYAFADGGEAWEYEVESA